MVFFALALLFFLHPLSYLEASLNKEHLVVSRSGMYLIDCVYVVNFEDDVEGWVKTRNALEAYSVYPERVDAGSKELFDRRQEAFRSAFFKKKPLSSDIWLIKDAYKKGYGVIWVVEDHISICKNPHQITHLISQLSEKDPDWDILYTDSERQNEEVDTLILEASCQFDTHSMLISKKGVEKLFHHFQKSRMGEVCQIPKMREYRSSDCSVAWEGRISSDTKIERADRKRWKKFQEETLSELRGIAGWCSKEKASVMMNLIREKKLHTCVEIGVFSGNSLFPIAKALEYNRFGIVYAVDSWSALEATQGFNKNSPDYVWWSELDYNSFYQQTKNLIRQSGLEKYCQIVKSSAKDASSMFFEETIDFLHFDGSREDLCVLKDVKTYFQKVKDGGYILLNDANWFCMRQALVYLLERADLVYPFSPQASYLLFQKNKAKAACAEWLLGGDV